MHMMITGDRKVEDLVGAHLKQLRDPGGGVRDLRV